MLAFFTPDKYGRRTVMVVSTFFGIISNGLIVFGPSMFYKKIGFFINGVMHLRIPLSFQHCTEMTPKPYADRVLTLIGAFDSATTGIACFYFLLINKSMNLLLIIYFGMGTCGCLGYWLIIHESPRFLLGKDVNSKKAREILNSMAKFNGSPYRLSLDSTYVEEENAEINAMSILNDSNN